ncbi:type IV pilin N-terminal domain-containing protein [Halalkaliarchaeum desulfuricum]|uniref:type IV pilin N-terminal domain-containing protein n=1 Tax=Halalkaliarchaeum desulfuricum TaxID=2055893 RepID=UPI00137AC886|nr:type IV pilin N-terminal domain-containing protein [Halalkaliarchaeum desulfuricum]
MTTADPRTDGTNRSSESTDRAQSEVIGSILVVALVVILVSTVGLAGLAAIGTFAPPEPAASVGLDGDVDEDGNLTLVVTHEGGDPLDPGEIVVLLGEGEERQSLDFYTETGDDSTFRPGERRELTAESFEGQVRVLVIHAPSGRTLGEGTITAR